MLHLAFWARLRPLQPPLVLRPYPLGLGQELTHVVPDGGVQDISAELRIPAQALATEAIGVGARAAVAAVTAPLADDQALKQVAAATGPVATALPVLLELSLNRPEEFLAHQPGNINENVIFRRCIDP